MGVGQSAAEKRNAAIEPSEAALVLMEGDDSNMTFEEPAVSTGVDGGGYFALTVAGKPRDRDMEGSEWWVGKDLSRACHELEFYHTASSLRSTRGWEVLDFVFQYGGFLKDFKAIVGKSEHEAEDEAEQESEDEAERESQVNLLVLEDVAGPLHLPRFMDIKLGDATGESHWMGKSQLAAWKQDLIDSHTTTALESLRVEAFVNPPGWLDSEDPLEDFEGWFGKDSKFAKKMRRFKLQRLTAREAVEAFLDFNAQATLEDVEAEPTDVEDHPVSRLSTKKKKRNGRPWKNELEDGEVYLQPAELSEVIALSLAKQLGQLLTACQEIAVPQKWINSSVALVADSGVFVERAAWAEGVEIEAKTGKAAKGPQHAAVHIFGWHRSELCTEEAFEAMTDKERQSRVNAWDSYMRGMQNLFVTSCFIYWTNFCVTEWQKLRIVVYDYDSSNENDMLGRLEIRLPEWKKGDQGHNRKYYLLDLHGNRILGIDRKFSFLNVCIWWVDYADPSRFKGAWRVHLRSGRHLTAADVHPTCFTESYDADPFAVVTAIESEASANQAGLLTGSRRTFKSRTEVQTNCLDPLWDAVFEFPVVGSAGGDSDAGLDAVTKVMAIPSGVSATATCNSSTAPGSACERFWQSRTGFEVGLDTFRNTLEVIEDDWIIVESEEDN